MRLISDDALAVVTIWMEARGEPMDGKIAVGEVIRNRMQARHRSDGTVAGTVLFPYQFSGWNTRDPNRVAGVKIDDGDETVQACVLAWEEAQNGRVAGGALSYLNVALTKTLREDGTLPPWAADPADPHRLHAKLVTAVIGSHTFLKT